MLFGEADHRVQQRRLLLGGAVQLTQAALNDIGMRLGDPLFQLAAAFVGLGLMDNHMDRSARPDGNHLLRSQCMRGGRAGIPPGRAGYFLLFSLKITNVSNKEVDFCPYLCYSSNGCIGPFLAYHSIWGDPVSVGTSGKAHFVRLPL